MHDRCAAALLILFVSGCAIQAPRSDLGRPATRSPAATTAQGLVGVTLYGDDLEFSDPTGTVEADLSQMPTLGFAGHYRLWNNERGDFEAGLDGSLLFSWWSDSRELVGVGGGTAVVRVSARLFVTDIGFGGYVSKRLGDKVRIYGAAGPLVQFGSGDFEDQVSSDSETGFGVGGYVRGGVEFALDQGTWLGFGARATAAEMDFSGQDDLDTDALQVFLTISKMF